MSHWNVVLSVMADYRGMAFFVLVLATMLAVTACFPDFDDGGEDTVVYPPPGPGTPLVNSYPVARFDIIPLNVEAGEWITLDGSRSSDDGYIASFHWVFGDGTSGLGETVPKQYSMARTYTVRLNVTDDAGQSAYRDRRVIVSSGIAAGPGIMDFVTIAITSLEYIGTDPSQEYIELTAIYPCSLQGYSLYSSSGASLVFMSPVALSAGETIRVYSGVGVSSGRSFYLGSQTEIWPDNQGTATLFDATATLVDAMSYGRY